MLYSWMAKGSFINDVMQREGGGGKPYVTEGHNVQEMAAGQLRQGSLKIFEFAWNQL